MTRTRSELLYNLQDELNMGPSECIAHLLPPLLGVASDLKQLSRAPWQPLGRYRGEIPTTASEARAALLTGVLEREQVSDIDGIAASRLAEYAPLGTDALGEATAIWTARFHGYLAFAARHWARLGRQWHEHRSRTERFDTIHDAVAHVLPAAIRREDDPRRRFTIRLEASHDSAKIADALDSLSNLPLEHPDFQLASVAAHWALRHEVLTGALS